MKNSIQQRWIMFMTGVLVFFSSCSSDETHTLYKIETGGKYGYIDSLGIEIIKPQYLLASDFNEGLAVIVVDTLITKGIGFFSTDSISYKYGYINTNNKIVLDTTFTYTEAYTEEIKKAIENSEITLKNLLFSYDRALFQDKKTKKKGYINKKGEIVINPIYIDGNQFSEGLAAVDFRESPIDDRKWGYIDIEGKIIVSGKYFGANDFREDRAIVLLADYGDENVKWGERLINFYWLVINKFGNVEAGPFNAIINTLFGYNNGYCIVQNENPLWGDYIGYKFIDKNGNYTTDFDIEDVTRYGYGYAGAKTDDGWVFIDTMSNIVSNIVYEEVKPFSNGYAAVKNNGKWGYIDTTFTQVIPYKFDDCGNFKKSLAPFTLRSQSLVIRGYINKKGKVVWQQEKFEYTK